MAKSSIEGKRIEVTRKSYEENIITHLSDSNICTSFLSKRQRFRERVEHRLPGKHLCPQRIQTGGTSRPTAPESLARPTSRCLPCLATRDLRKPLALQRWSPKRHRSRKLTTELRFKKKSERRLRGIIKSVT